VDDMTDPVRDPAREQLRLMWRVAGMAFMVSAEVAAGAGIGWLIDRWAGTGQRWMTIGGIAGIAVGLTTFIRAAFQLSRSSTPARDAPPTRDTDDDG
jgi:F0F1-type ATP synthase assembly protein I